MSKKYDLIIGVPCSDLDYDSCIPFTREDEAVAFACGAIMAGKKPYIFMQNSGFFNCLDTITSLGVPYGIELDIEVSNRTEPEHHKLGGAITPKIMGMIFETHYSHTGHIETHN